MEKKLRITFLGNFGVDYSTESHHLWTYRKLGHDVVPLQEGRARASQIHDEALKSDLFVWTHTHGWHTEGMDRVLQVLKNKGIPSVGYHLDLWKGLMREADLVKDHYWNIEYFFTVDKQFIPDLEKLGIKAHFLPAGVVEKETYMAEPSKRYQKHEIIFVGSYGYHPEWNYRPKLIDWLKINYRDRFGHYGGDGLGVIRGHELNRLYASAKVVIGDTLCIGFDYPEYFSDRLFETVGRGGFTIFPHIKGIEKYYKIDKELVTYEFDNFEQLREKITYYLSHDRERRNIQKAGFNRTLKDHTYTSRLNSMLNTIFDDKE